MPVIHGIVVDCNDAEKVAAFWREALGYEIRHKGHGWVSLRNPSGQGPFLSFDTVPEGKVVKNRVHLDIRPTERSREAERERLETLGATVVRLVDDNPDDPHYIMADPEGNEFCVLEPE